MNRCGLSAPRVGGAARAVLTGLPSTIWAIMRRHGIEPAPRRAELSWWEFLRAQASTVIACDFLTVDTVGLRRVCLLYRSRHSARALWRRHIESAPARVTQQARNLVKAR